MTGTTGATRPGNRAQEIWVAYPTAQMQANKTYAIRAAAAWKMTEADPARGSDPQEVSEKSVDASVNYMHSEWEYPAGSFGVYKYTDSHPSHTHTTPAKSAGRQHEQLPQEKPYVRHGGRRAAEQPARDH
jgi:hypothetical protein